MIGHGIKQRMGAASRIGPRETNQDAYALQDALLDAAGVAVLAVADGMGGLEGGELASRAALDEALKVLGRQPTPDALRQAFAAAHEGVLSVARDHGLSGTGTTLTLALVLPGEAVIAHVGDTRAYLLNGPSFTQVTEDHSRVGRLLQEGLLTEEQAMAHPEQNVLERALGAGELPEVDIYRVGVGPGDVLLLSTDGLHGVLGRDELERELRASSSLQEACDMLTSLAERRGSQDNITAVAWEYPDGDLSAPRPPTQVRLAPAPAAAVPAASVPAGSPATTVLGPRPGPARPAQANDVVVLVIVVLVGFLVGAGLGFMVGLQ